MSDVTPEDAVKRSSRIADQLEQGLWHLDNIRHGREVEVNSGSLKALIMNALKHIPVPLAACQPWMQHARDCELGIWITPSSGPIIDGIETIDASLGHMGECSCGLDLFLAALTPTQEPR